MVHPSQVETPFSVGDSLLRWRLPSQVTLGHVILTVEANYDTHCFLPPYSNVIFIFYLSKRSSTSMHFTILTQVRPKRTLESLQRLLKCYQKERNDIRVTPAVWSCDGGWLLSGKLSDVSWLHPLEVCFLPAVFENMADRGKAYLQWALYTMPELPLLFTLFLWGFEHPFTCL